jgi:hypothetical protein
MKSTTAAAIAVALFAPQAALAADSPNQPPRNARPAELAIAIDGAPVRVTLNPAGKLGRLTFQAREGQRVGLGLTGVKYTPASAAALVVSVREPDGSLLADPPRIHCLASAAASCDAEFTVAHAGRHTIEIDPPFSAVAEFTATLSSPAVAPLRAGGSHTVSLSRAGQDARLALSLEPGAEVSVSARTTTPESAGRAPFALKVYRPDGSLLRTEQGDSLRAASIAVSGEPGTYAVEVDPANGATGTFVLAAKLPQGIALNGPAIAFRTESGPARVSFNANAGQSVTATVLGLKHSPDVDSNSRLAVLGPDGRRIEGLGCITKPHEGSPNRFVPPCKVTAYQLPVSGRYTVEVSPPVGAAASGELALSEVLAGEVSPASAAQIGPLRPGQMARLGFKAAAGQKVSARLNAFTTVPAGQDVTMWLVRLDGPFNEFNSRISNRKAPVTMSPQPLADAGRYAIVVDAGLAAIESAEVTLVEEGKAQ